MSPGYVSKVVQALEERGYVARREEGLALRNGQDLLQDWVHAAVDPTAPVMTTAARAAPRGTSS